ncbi:phospholipase B1, membrane-associated-like [Ptychodera flava]|uniref:phospholipase B1, membrane-associated-like n=1 Tax=Ptychodera flava TaxID=63121 RepID=UPI00396A4FA3
MALKGTTLLLCACLIGFCSASDQYNPWDEYLKAIDSLSEEQKTKERIVKPFLIDPPEEFPCEVKLPGLFDRPQGIDVHHLHPTDIRVIGALGDSLTAGNGAKATNPVQCLFEYRGVVYSVGGDDHPVNGSTLTVATLLKDFYAQNGLEGYSTGRGNVNSPGANLNVAVPGAVSENMASQTEMLVERLKEDPNINYYHDWKMVTLFIGGNDLCGWCRDRERFAPENYINNIRKALDIMHAELPKTFVNLVSVLQVTEINKLDSPFCNIMHRFLCPCAKLLYTNETEVAELVAIMREYQRLTKELVHYGRYDTRDDFTVVVQPFLEYTGLPWNEEEGNWDDSLMAPDCFHFSEVGHQLSAGGLWNNMYEDVGNKTGDWDWNNLYVTCPEADSFFKTRLNSERFYTPVTRKPTTPTKPTITTTTKTRTTTRSTAKPPATTKAMISETVTSTTTTLEPVVEEPQTACSKDYTGFLVLLFCLLLSVAVCVVILLILAAVYINKVEKESKYSATAWANQNTKYNGFQNGAYSMN